MMDYLQQVLCSLLDMLMLVINLLMAGLYMMKKLAQGIVVYLLR